MSDYVKVNDDGDGEVIVESEEGSIDILYYHDSVHQKKVRNKAEKIAEKKAKELNCDWGTNY